jgi:hypothetical protein
MIRVLGIVVVNVLIGLAMLALLDRVLVKGTVFQNAAKRAVSLREHSPDRSYWVRPSKELISMAEGLDSMSSLLTTDRNGFIIGPADTAWTDKSVDIIFLGGSTTECVFVDETLRFPYLVSRSMCDGELRTLNAGFGGSSSFHSLMVLLSKGLPEKPKVAVLMHNANDLIHLTMTGSYHASPESRAVVSDIPVPKPLILQPLSQRMKSFLEFGGSIIAPNLTSRLTLPSYPDEMDEWDGYREGQGRHDMSAIIRAFEGSLSTFVHTCRSHGIVPVLMTQFSRLYRDDEFVRSIYPSENGIPYDEACDNYHRFNELVRNIAKRMDVSLIDLAIMVPPTSDYIYDGVHLSNKGSVLVADSVARYLSIHLPGLCVSDSL